MGDCSGNCAKIAVATIPAGCPPTGARNGRLSADINSAEDNAPGPYNVAAPIVAVGADTALGLLPLNLNLGVAALDVSVFSDVDGTSGSRSVDGVSSITDASVSLDLGAFNLVSLSLDSGITVLESSSSILWDGITTLTPEASSNLVSSRATVGGATITLSILGVSITIPALAPNTEFHMDLDITLPLISLQGDLFITADKISEEIVGDAAYARATTLSVYLDVSADVRQDTGLFIIDLASIDFTTSIDINKTTAKMLAKNDASLVPETGMTLAMLSGSFIGLALLRRRLA